MSVPTQNNRLANNEGGGEKPDPYVKLLGYKVADPRNPYDLLRLERDSSPTAGDIRGAAHRAKEKLGTHLGGKNHTAAEQLLRRVENAEQVLMEASVKVAAGVGGTRADVSAAIADSPADMTVFNDGGIKITVVPTKGTTVKLGSPAKKDAPRWVGDPSADTVINPKASKDTDPDMEVAAPPIVTAPKPKQAPEGILSQLGGYVQTTQGKIVAVSTAVASLLAMAGGAMAVNNMRSTPDKTEPIAEVRPDDTPKLTPVATLKQTTNGGEQVAVSGELPVAKPVAAPEAVSPPEKVGRDGLTDRQRNERLRSFAEMGNPAPKPVPAPIQPKPAPAPIQVAQAPATPPADQIAATSGNKPSFSPAPAPVRPVTNVETVTRWNAEDEKTKAEIGARKKELQTVLQIEYKKEFDAWSEASKAGGDTRKLPGAAKVLARCLQQYVTGMKDSSPETSYAAALIIEKLAYGDLDLGIGAIDLAAKAEQSPPQEVEARVRELANGWDRTGMKPSPATLLRFVEAFTHEAEYLLETGDTTAAEAAAKKAQGLLPMERPPFSKELEAAKGQLVQLNASIKTRKVTQEKQKVVTDALAKLTLNPQDTDAAKVVAVDMVGKNQHDSAIRVLCDAGYFVGMSPDVPQGSPEDQIHAAAAWEERLAAEQDTNLRTAIRAMVQKSYQAVIDNPSASNVLKGLAQKKIVPVAPVVQPVVPPKVTETKKPPVVKPGPKEVVKESGVDLLEALKKQGIHSFVDSGRWKEEGEGITSDLSTWAKIHFPTTSVNPNSYKVSAVIKRVKGDGAICFVVPVGNTQAGFVIEGWNGFSFITNVKGKSPDQNPAAVRGQVLAPGNNDISCLVKADPNKDYCELVFELKGKTLYKYEGKISDLNIDPLGPGQSPENPAGISTYGASVQFLKIQVEDLK